MDTDVVMRVHEPPVVKMRYVEAKIKPEQVKDVTPGWEPTTVTPDEGCALSRVNVAGMPEPTEVVEIATNGDHHVERAGIARVQVPIPPGYIIPSGKRVFTENGTDIDVRELESVDITVPVPVMPDEYAIGGSLHGKTLVGYHFPANTDATNLLFGFEGCLLLEYIENFPQALTKIQANSFAQCSKLSLTDLPDYITSIEYGAFSGCTSLALTKLPSSLLSLGQNAFVACSNITITKIPNGITSIVNNVFNGCSKLALTELPSGLTSIGIAAFAGCSEIVLTELPSGLTSIGAFAFSGCSKLALTELPSGITTFGQGVFQNCTGLHSMKFNSKPASLTGNFFNGCTNLLNIYVPWAEGEVANAPWGAVNATITYNYTGA